MRRPAVLLAVPLLAALALPATAAPFEPVLTEQPFFFTCGDQKVDNVRRAQAGLPPTWSPQRPTGSVAGGAGCGSADAPFTQAAPDNMYDTTWAGTVEGNLDSVTVELHSLDVARSRAGGTGQLQVRLMVDGEEVLAGPEGLGTAVTVTPVPSSTRASDAYVFTVTGLDLLEERDQGLHDVVLLVNGGAVVRRGPTVMDAVHGWVWGAAEVPAGVVFNDATPAAVTVPAQR